MKEVSWLDLDDNKLGDQGIQDLINAPVLENIQYLNLSKNGISDQGLEILAKAEFLGKLKRLHLKGNPIKGRGVIALFESKTFTVLSWFKIFSATSRAASYGRITPSQSSHPCQPLSAYASSGRFGMNHARVEVTPGLLSATHSSHSSRVSRPMSGWK